MAVACMFYHVHMLQNFKCGRTHFGDMINTALAAIGQRHANCIQNTLSGIREFLALAAYGDFVAQSIQHADEETIAEYLTAALEDDNPDVFLSAVADVAKVRGMSQLA
jgi:hypothetical protein